MDQKHRNLIRKNLDQLVEKTHDIRDIVDILKEKGILNDYQARIILKVSFTTRNLRSTAVHMNLFALDHFF